MYIGIANKEKHTIAMLQILSTVHNVYTYVFDRSKFFDLRTQSLVSEKFLLCKGAKLGFSYFVSYFMPGCQMVHFHTKNPNVGI
jgi:hypothetical protein